MDRKSKWIKGALTVAAVMGVAAMIAIGFPRMKAGPPLSRGHENDLSSRDPAWRAQQKADADYNAELKKETTPVDTSRQLQNVDKQGNVYYLCVNGFVYVHVDRGMAPYITDDDRTYGGHFTKCSEFK
jgi:hypothetical protein